MYRNKYGVYRKFPMTSLDPPFPQTVPLRPAPVPHPYRSGGMQQCR